MTEIVNRMGFNSAKELQEDILIKTGVGFCPREYFCRPLSSENQYYGRFTYAGISKDEIKEGLSRLKYYCES